MKSSHGSQRIAELRLPLQTQLGYFGCNDWVTILYFKSVCCSHFFSSSSSTETGPCSVNKQVVFNFLFGIHCVISSVLLLPPTSFCTEFSIILFLRVSCSFELSAVWEFYKKEWTFFCSSPTDEIWPFPD